MKTFSTLYKKTSTGAIQQWNIAVIDLDDPTGTGNIKGPGGILVTRFGQVDGKIQETRDLITEGKNCGKINETTPIEQAIAEAQSKWEKQKKKGYVTSKEAAQNEEVDALVEGGIVPMLAHPFSKHGHKINYPCYVQGKLDGIRCIAILEDGECTLWSRTRKIITGVPHIARAIEKAFKGQDLILDGELYNHEFKKDFEKVVSFVRQEEPKKGHEIVQYHIYDIVTDKPFSERIKSLIGLFLNNRSSELKLVDTGLVNSEDDVMELFDQYIKLGYEGSMLRNTDGLYVNKRSYDLQKVKEFDDSEFPIIGVEEGRGKLAGHAIFVCKTEDGTTFQVKMKGATEKLKEYFEDHSLWEGKELTVQFQGKTAYNVPRFPVGIAVRDYE